MTESARYARQGARDGWRIGCAVGVRGVWQALCDAAHELYERCAPEWRLELELIAGRIGGPPSKMDFGVCVPLRSEALGPDFAAIACEGRDLRHVFVGQQQRLGEQVAREVLALCRRRHDESPSRIAHVSATCAGVA